MEQTLVWDAIYEIALALIAQYPQEDLENVSLENILDWTLNLPR